MNSFRMEFKLGSILYLGIFVLAVGLRFIHLGYFPLTNEESLAALRAAEGTSFASPFYIESSSAVPQPAYEILTQIAFNIFGANNFLARFIPAFAGALLVLTPLLLREKIGWGQTVLMGFLISVCPVFITVARTASGVSLSALGATAFILGISGLNEKNKQRNTILAGIGLGLCLASGPYLFTVILILGISLLIWKLLIMRSDHESWSDLVPLKDLRQILWITAAALFVFTTGAGLYLDGISKLFSSAASWIVSWGEGGSFANVTILAMIPVYMPGLMLLGILGAWSYLRRSDKVGVLAVLLALFGLIVVTVFPGHQPQDLIWIALPLSYLGSGYLISFSQYIYERKIEPWVIAIVSILILFAGMIYMQLSNLSNQGLLMDPVSVLITLASIVVLLIIIISFIGLGWNWISARLSVILALFILVGFLSISALWHLNFSSQVLTPSELWRNEVPSAGMDLLIDTIKTTSQMVKGTDYGLEIELIGSAPNSLVWALKDFRQYEDSSMVDDTGSPVVLVSKTDDELDLQDDYIGQTITISEEWGWSSALPPDLLRWWVKRRPEIEMHEWLMLIREDLVALTEG